MLDAAGLVVVHQTQVFAGEVKDLEWDPESKRIVAVGEGQGTVRGGAEGAVGPSGSVIRRGGA